MYLQVKSPGLTFGGTAYKITEMWSSDSTPYGLIDRRLGYLHGGKWFCGLDHRQWLARQRRKEEGMFWSCRWRLAT